MIQYNTLHARLSNSQLNKLKSGITNGTEVTLNLSSNAVGESNDESNFPYKLLWTNTFQKFATLLQMVHQLIQIFQKTELSKMVQFRGILMFGQFFRPLFDKITNSVFKTALDAGFLKGSALTLTNNEKKDVIKVIRSLENRGIFLKGTSKKLLVKKEDFLFLKRLMTAHLRLTAVASATDAAIQKEIFGSGTTTLVFSNEELNYIMKIVKFLEESGVFLIKGVS